jgi:hypothetical protein
VRPCAGRLPNRRSRLTTGSPTCERASRTEWEIVDPCLAVLIERTTGHCS